jgi:hypothetical protein
MGARKMPTEQSQYPSRWGRAADRFASMQKEMPVLNWNHPSTVHRRILSFQGFEGDRR